MSGTCQPIKVKSGGRDDLSQYNGAAFRWAHGADEFLYQILSAFDCHDFLWGCWTILATKSLIPRLQAHVKQFITDHNRIFPTSFAKFGDARLVSLDELMFEDGSATRGDTVSRGLWDQTRRAAARGLATIVWQPGDLLPGSAL